MATATGEKQPAAQPMPTRGGAEEIAATGDERTAEGETAIVLLRK